MSSQRERALEPRGELGEAGARGAPGAEVEIGRRRDGRRRGSPRPGGAPRRRLRSGRPTAGTSRRRLDVLGPRAGRPGGAPLGEARLRRLDDDRGRARRGRRPPAASPRRPACARPGAQHARTRRCLSGSSSSRPSKQMRALEQSASTPASRISSTSSASSTSTSRSGCPSAGARRSAASGPATSSGSGLPAPRRGCSSAIVAGRPGSCRGSTSRSRPSRDRLVEAAAEQVARPAGRPA